MRRRLPGIIAAIFLLVLFALSLAPVWAEDVDSRIQSLQERIAALKKQQIELRKDAEAAAAAMPTFSYRPGAGLSVTQAAQAAPLTKIVVSVEEFGAHHPNHLLPILIAMDKGWFKAEGIADVVWKDAGSDANTVKGLIDGSIHFGADPQPDVVLEANAKGKEVYIIGGVRTKYSYEFVSIPGITGPDALKGKLVAASRAGSSSDRRTRLILERIGLNPDKDVKIVYKGRSDQRMAALLKGEVHAAVINEEEIEKYRKQIERHPRVVDVAKIWPDYQARVIATSGQMLRDHPETVKAFLKVMIKTFQFIKANTRDMAYFSKLIEKAAGKPPEEELSDHSYLAGRLPDDGGINLKGLKVVVEEEKAMGNLPKDYAVEKALRLNVVNEAAAELNRR